MLTSSLPTFIDLIADVHCGSIEGVIVLGVVEYVEQSNSLLKLVIIKNREYLSSRKRSHLLPMQELPYCGLVLKEISFCVKKQMHWNTGGPYCVQANVAFDRVALGDFI